MDYEFKVGDVVRTRDGRKARILAVDVAGPQPIVAAVSVGGVENVGQFCADGRYYLTDRQTASDLMPPKKVWYVNVYSDGSAAGINSTRRDADKVACSNRIACVRVEEGQFDE